MQQAPLKVALEAGVTAGVASGQSDANEIACRLESRLLPEQRHQPTDLYEGGHPVVSMDGQLSLHKVGHVTLVIHTPDIQSMGGGVT